MNDKQKIMVWCNRTENLETTSRYAIYIASFLKKEVCFFANYRSTREKKRLRDRINSLQNQLTESLITCRHSMLLLGGKLDHLITELADQYESVLFCCPGKITFSLLRAFYKSRTPFLFARTEKPLEYGFRRLLIPVDFRESVKDAALWGSYFGRLNGSEIVLVEPTDTDRDLWPKVVENLDAITRLYQKFNFPFHIEKSTASSWSVHGAGLKLATSSDLLVFTGSFNVSLPDYLIGPFERRLVNRAKDVPVLLVNPRHEMCVICD